MRLPFISWSIAGVPSSQGYLNTAPPSVCVPDAIGALAVWIQKQNKTKQTLVVWGGMKIDRKMIGSMFQLQGCHLIPSAFCVLPYYCAPPVGFPNVIGGLAVCRHYKPKTKKSGPKVHRETIGFEREGFLTRCSRPKLWREVVKWWNPREQFQNCCRKNWRCSFAPYQSNSPSKWQLRTRCGGHNLSQISAGICSASALPCSLDELLQPGNTPQKWHKNNLNCGMGSSYGTY